jgi:CrcB protein
MGFISKSHTESPDLKWLLVSGFCGGFTTFSAFGYENVVLMRSGHFSIAIAYISLSIVAGLSAVWIGLALSR